MTTIITYNISCDICGELCEREYSEGAALAKAIKYGGVRRQDAHGNIIDECFRCVERQSIRHYMCSCRDCAAGKWCGCSQRVLRLPAPPRVRRQAEDALARGDWKLGSDIVVEVQP